MSKPARPRTARREADRAARALVRDREKLASLSPGGASDRPIAVPSPAVIEGRARAMPCPQCDGPLEVIEHVVVVVDGVRLRRVDARCRTCGAPRSLWFVLAAPPEPN